MARTITNAVYVAPQTPLYTQQFVCLMNDATLWILNAGTGVWTQMPAIPGGRVVTCILSSDPHLAPFVAMCFAACQDGTFWSAPLTTGVWVLSTIATPP